MNQNLHCKNSLTAHVSQARSGAHKVKCFVQPITLSNVSNSSLETLVPREGVQVMWCCNDRECRLCETLAKLSGMLEENQWTGPIDINTVVSKEGEIYALEFTPRLGYDAFPTFLYGLFESDFGQFVYNSCHGES